MKRFHEYETSSKRCLKQVGWIFVKQRIDLEKRLLTFYGVLKYDTKCCTASRD